MNLRRIVRILSLAAMFLSLAALAQNPPQNSTPSPRPSDQQPATAQPMTPQALSAQPTNVQTDGATPVNLQNPAANSTQGLGNTTPGATSSAANPADILIGPGDLITVGVVGAPEYSQDLRVSGSGDISLPLVGSVHVAGLSVTQAQELIRKHLMDGGYFNNPQVTVFEKEYATQGVSVLGEVQHPGVYPLLGPHSLFDALSLAGGTSELAGNAITITHRANPTKPEVVTFNNNGKNAQEANVKIYPGDTVVVSKAGVVYVVGQVTRPTGVVLNDSGITVLQAIAMAEGIKSGAAMNSAKIIRRGEGEPKEIPVPLKKMFSGKSPDVKLQAQDILFVPVSTAKNVGVQTLNGIVRLTTAVAVYRLP